MKSKRLLSLFLALCLVISVMSPAVFATTASEDSYVSAGQLAPGKGEKTPEISNDLFFSGDDADTNKIGTRRDEDLLKPQMESPSNVNGTGTWFATESLVNPTVSLKLNAVPACIEELEKAAEVFASNDRVVAFVVMEEAPLAEVYSTIVSVSDTSVDGLLQVQDEVIDEIEQFVLEGEELDVRYQFTYLTNAFSIETEFANLEKIAELDGVKSVYIMPVYSAITTYAAEPNTFSASEMTGVTQVWEDLGYTGEGMTIAVIDTGLDLDHPSFAADPAGASMTLADIEAVLENLNAFANKPDLTAEDLYRSVKVPYAFNYVDNNLSADHSRDQQGDHGTHVAGIAAANAVEGVPVVGMAPDAQIIVMKVFGANGGAYTDDIVAALEDAMTLGCDVVNLSLGSPSGFSSTDTEIDLIYERLNSQDIVATISAGNEGTSSYDNMWGTDMNRTQNPDNATIDSPSTFVNAFSIASADNAKVMAKYIALADGTKVVYNNSYEWNFGTVPGMEILAGEELEFVVIDGLGNFEDFFVKDEEGNPIEDEYGDYTSLVEGKVAIVSRGEITFGEKIYNAELAGAVACLIWNNDNGNILEFYINTTLTDADGNEFYPTIPCALISLADGQVMADAESNTMTVAEDMTVTDNANAGKLSSFSSWGVAPDLRLEPDITGVGGSVLSCYDDGQYGYMSGTSMSAPQIAGVTALVMQRLQELYPNAPEGSLRDLAEAMLMSTADPIFGDYAEASPRQQGAGLVNAYEAITTNTYLTVGGNMPKVSMGDSATGKFTFSFEVHNIGSEAVTYQLDASLLSEYVVSSYGEYFMAGYDISIPGFVTFDKEAVTVPAGGKANVMVTIELDEESKEYFHTYWENGGYVEGFVYLSEVDAEGVVVDQLNLPYMGFYGDWTEAPVLDSAFWYGNGFWGAGDGWPEGDEYYHVFWTDLAGQDWVLGFNPYSGALFDANNNVIYDEAHNIISPNGDGVIDGLEEIYLSLLRAAKVLTFTYTVDGEVVHKESYTNNPKTMYVSSYGQIIPWLYSWYGDGMYDFTDAQGKVLADGTEIMLTVDAFVDYGMGGDHSFTLPIYVDSTAPELVDVYEVVQDGACYMVVEAKDATDLAAIYLMNTSGSRVYDVAYDVDMLQAEDGNWLAYFDVTELGTKFSVVLCDYGANESYYDVTYTAAGDNLPDMTPYAEELFAYRVYDDHIYSDHMFGWVSMNKPASADEYTNLSVWTDDYLEYAAINAAEYVDGKIFAVDAVYNLVVMEPGLFDRQTICNLGINVLDMTFDDSTDTMYVLTKDPDKYVALWSMDLLTGAMEMVYDYGYYYYAPFAIADDDNGTLYAIKYDDAGIYTISAENDWEMLAITDAEGNDLVIMDSEGNSCSPQYAQGLTYENGNLYWAYYRYTYYGGSSELITINTTDWTYYGSMFAGMAYDTENNLVDYYPVIEAVGLLTLTDTDYEIPASTELSEVILTADSLLMKVGDTQKVSAYGLPWNYEIQNETWSSSDETVATVINGKVTGIREGTATITVVADGVEASLEVRVVEVEGDFYAYNYYSLDGYYGYLINVDMETMNYGLESAAPVDFIAGDYNGHDGCFYGYTEAGQMYCWNLNTGDFSAVGAIGDFPIDMAYDYSTGIMYGMFTDLNTYQSQLRMINMKTGATEVVVDISNDYGVSGLFTLACDDSGKLYTLDYMGYLYNIAYVYDDWYETWSYQMFYSDTIYDSLGELGYVQSMCWDYANDVLIWAHCDGTSVNWIDVNEGFMLKLGDPTESGMFEFTGMFTVPADIPELPYTAVESVVANDMLLLVGGAKPIDVTVYPFNATNQNFELTSADESIAVIENGMVVAVGEGETTISYKLVDGENVLEGAITVTVLQGADNVFGYLLTDIASYAGQYWMEIYPQDTQNPAYLEYTDYIFFSEEYVDGLIYGYGYDPNDWEANWQYFVMDTNHSVISQTDLGEGFPYVYDMTYDYATGTMFALAGASEDDMNLYVADVETGRITLLKRTAQNFMSIAAGRDGTLYAIENSVFGILGYDDWGWEIYGNTNAQLYAIDSKTLEITYVGDTGMVSNMIASMAFDFDTDVLYWTPLDGDTYNSGLAILNTETGVATNLGPIGAAGSQVAGLYIIADVYPEVDASELYTVVVNPAKAGLNVGETINASVITIPMNLDGAEIVWSTSNKKVATVDENGLITAVQQGKAEITAAVTYNGKTVTGTCVVSVLAEDAGFLTWNRTDMGWSEISRADYTVVTNLTEGEEVGVSAIGVVGADVYAVDTNNGFFKLNTETYEREYIVEELDVDYSDFPEGNEYYFYVRDMEYDSLGDRMLVLGAIMMYDDFYESIEEIYDGCAVYELDLTTGELTKLYTFYDIIYVYGMAAGTNGEVYFYTTFDDGVYKLDIEDESYSKVVSLQTQSLYGEYGADIRHGMFYDDLTDVIYMTFTSNGNYYRMINIDAATGTVSAYTEDGDQLFIGEVLYDEDMWAYSGDLFNGLVFVNEHSHECEFGEWTVVVEATCTEPGLEQRECECGEIETREIDATGHDYEDGNCKNCGEEDPDYEEPTEPTEPEPTEPQKPGKPSWWDWWNKFFGGGNKCDHDYTSNVVYPSCESKGYTEHTCSKCGNSYKDSYTNALGHDWDAGEVTKEATCTENGVKTYTCETCSKTKTETIKAIGHDYHNGVCGNCGKEESTKPGKPGWGSIWDWFFGGWWK